ncbi:MAG: hypothetical protein JWL77_6232 [Chthonomonadaceae bacterium]|nr:hypothetical protein [Chthonomonadaceae bacterium]
MRRRAALYLLLGFVTALLVVAMATGLQTRASYDPAVWMKAHRHVPLLQMVDLSAAFLFVVIGTYGLTVSRLQMQMRHQAEDFGDQMQSLLHRNEELAKVNEEYAEQIASLEVAHTEPPALALGDSGQRVIAALHWQVDSQARQLEAVHQTLAQQHDALEELHQHVHAREGSAAPSLTGVSASSPQLTDAPPSHSMPAETDSDADLAEDERIGIVDFTVNDGSTLVGETLDFDVSAFASPEPSPPDRPKPNAFAATRTYPVDDSFLAMAAGHISSIPEPTPPPEPERVEISVGKGSATPIPSEPYVAAAEPPQPYKTQVCLDFDLAESALSSLQSETQEALSSLRAQVEATLPPAPTAESESDKSDQPARRKPWHLRF